MVNPHAHIVFDVTRAARPCAGRPSWAGRSSSSNSSAGRRHGQEGHEAHDDRPAPEERRALSQPDRAREHRRRRHRQGDLPHRELRRAGTVPVRRGTLALIAIAAAHWLRGPGVAAAVAVTLARRRAARSVDRATCRSAVAYLKASNTDADGPLRLRRRAPGPRRLRRRDQRRRQHAGGGRAARERRREGRQRQPARQLGVRRRRGVRVHASRRRLDAAGLRQGVEPADERRVRPRRRAQRRRQHAGRVGVLGSRATPRASTAIRSDESIPQAGAVYVFTRTRHDLDAAGLHQGVQHRRGRHGRHSATAISSASRWRSATTAARWRVGALTEDSAPPASTATRPTTRRRPPAPSTCSRARARRGRSRPTSSRRTPTPATCSATAVALSADGNMLAVGSLRRGRIRARDQRPARQHAATARARPTCSRAPATTWAQQAYIKPSNAEAQDSFGVDVALSDDGNTLLVGSLDEDCTATGVNPPRMRQRPRATTCRRAPPTSSSAPAGTWSQQAFLKASNTGPNDWFGSRAALSGDGNMAVLGASLEDGAARASTASRTTTTRPRLARCMSSPHRHDVEPAGLRQGREHRGVRRVRGSVALSRDGRTLVVTAHGEDGASNGVGGNQADNGAEEAGAAYVLQQLGGGGSWDPPRVLHRVFRARRQPEAQRPLRAARRAAVRRR